MDYLVPTGLLIGIVSVIINYFLLVESVKNIIGGRTFLAIQFFALRYIIYLAAIFFCVKMGTNAAIAFSFALVVTLLTIAIASTIKGNRAAKKEAMDEA